MPGIMHHYVFDVLKVEKMETYANLYNTNSIGVFKKFGNRVVKQDDKFMYFEGTADDFHKVSEEIDGLLSSFFTRE